MIAAGIVLAASMAAAWIPDGDSARRSTEAPPLPRPGRSVASVGAAALGGPLLAVGILATLAGADPSRVSAALLTTPFGLASPQSLDAWRTAMLASGVVLVLAGAAILLARRVDGATLFALPTLLLAMLAASEIVAALSFAAPLDSNVPGERTISLVGTATLLGAGLGILIGAAWVSLDGRARLAALVGCLALGSATLLGVAALLAPLPLPIGVGPLVATVAIGSLGGGIAASILRLTLADAPTELRGLAAAGGVTAASFGAALGITIGNGAGLARVTGESGGTATAIIVLLVAAVAALALARRAAVARRVAGQASG